MYGIDTNKFAAIQLHEMDAVRLMNRVDRKFCIHRSRLSELLLRIRKNYYMLEIDGERQMLYNNIYFDSSTNEMYNDHLRGKTDRYKIRLRTYEQSQVSFLEIKRKNNRGKTFKKRIQCHDEQVLSQAQHASFVSSYSPFEAKDLVPVLKNRFTRLTLVSKNFNARCTIDYDISFRYKKSQETLNDIAVVEIKSEGNDKQIPILLALRDMHLPASGFSKYCMGRSILDNNLKNNAYKPKIMQVKKISNIYNN